MLSLSMPHRPIYALCLHYSFHSEGFRQLRGYLTQKANYLQVETRVVTNVTYENDG